MRSLLRFAWLGLALVVAPDVAGAQQSVPPMRVDANPSFEVATIKLSDPANGSSGFQTDGRRVTVLNETVESMLIFAYGVQKSQIIGAPAWFASDHYDIRGVPDVPGEPNFDQVKGMVRKLLADRYSLKMHPDQRELLVYALRLSKGGPRMATNPNPSANTSDQTGNNGRLSDWRFTNQSMDDFAQFLQFAMDRPVVNQTALPGKYDFRLKWASDQVLEKDPEAGASIFTAIQEQIGLKMDAVKAPAKVFVIDHVERPSEN